MTDNLLFVDLETTGLDPHAPDAAILEIALLVATPDGRELAGWSSPVHWEGAVHRLHPRVQEMHADNGLFAECATAPPLALVEKSAREFLTAQGMFPFGFSERPAMGGSSVHFDRKWLEVHMKRFVGDVWHYRNLDATSLWIWGERHGLEVPAPANAHRALEDCRASLRLLNLVWSLHADQAVMQFVAAASGDLTTLSDVQFAACEHLFEETGE